MLLVLIRKIVPRMPATPFGVFTSNREAVACFLTLPKIEPFFKSSSVSVTVSALVAVAVKESNTK